MSNSFNNRDVPIRRLPLAYSCDRRLSELEGDSTVRHCGGCDRDVINLSSLDEASARSLLAQQTVPACVHYRHRRGKIVFAKTARAAAFAAAAAILLAAAPARADTSVPAPHRKREKKRQPRKREAEPQPRNEREDFEEGLLKPVL